MRLEQLCAIDVAYIDGFHLTRPYGNEGGIGWGIGDGTVTGDRLSGTARWSNQPARRSDGAMLPNVRGVIATPDGAEVFFDLTGRTFFVERDGQPVGSQMLMALFESDDPEHAWLNDTVCMAEGAIDPAAGSAHFEVFICHNDVV